MNSPQHLKLVLLLIAQVPAFRDTYSLIKVLNNFFKIFDPRPLFEELEKRHWMKREAIDYGQHYHSITVAGEAFLKEEFETFVQELHQEFPDHREMIERVIQRSQ